MPGEGFPVVTGRGARAAVAGGAASTAVQYSTLLEDPRSLADAAADRVLAALGPTVGSPTADRRRSTTAAVAVPDPARSCRRSSCGQTTSTTLVVGSRLLEPRARRRGGRRVRSRIGRLSRSGTRRTPRQRLDAGSRACGRRRTATRPSRSPPTSRCSPRRRGRASCTTVSWANDAMAVCWYGRVVAGDGVGARRDRALGEVERLLALGRADRGQPVLAACSCGAPTGRVNESARKSKTPSVPGVGKVVYWLS